MIAFPVLFAGCDGPQRRPTRAMASDDRRMERDTGQDHLARAYEFLDNFHQYDEREIIPKIHYHLQEWVETRRPDDDWLADPLFSRLPRSINIDRSQTTLSRLKFSDADILMLREAIWLNNLARQIVQREVRDDELAAWLASSDLPEEVTRDLASVIESFDWILRNLQQESTAAGQELAKLAGVEPPPPGCSRSVWESILVARGDWLVRARCWILLCRQMKIPVVMLGIEEESGIRPWAPAAWLGGELYLFDTQWGLPIPKSDGEGVATLSQLAENPAWLRQLDVEGQRYPVAAEDLKNVVAMIDATPSYLSQRMKILERDLGGDQKLTLSVSAISISQELKKQAKQIVNVSIWPLPYQLIDYRIQNRGNNEFIARLDATVRPFSGESALAHGRRQHLRGMYASDPPKKGARQYYLECRIPDAQLARPKFTDELLNTLGWRGPLPPEEQQQPFVAVQVARLRFFKSHASYFLGLIAMEQQQHRVAIDFFEKRILDKDPDGVFADGARYNLARSYEALGKETGDSEMVAKAVRLLQEDTSPQAAGNAVRARRLEGR